MASPTSLKRTSADAGLDGNPQPQVPSTTSTPLTTLPSSPVDTPEFCPGPSTRPNPIHHVIPTDSTAPAFLEKSNKRSKLTFAEKEAREIEKQFKEQQRAEEKVKKEIERVKREEERIKREEEKRIRDAAKEERKKAKEQQAKLRKVEKQKRLDEKQKLEEEKNKKARSQLRLNAFFVQPSMLNGNSSGSPTHECPSSQGSRRSSISDINAMEKHRRSRSVSSTPQKPRLPHYERSFPPFFVQSHTVLAPQNRFVRDRESSGFSIKIDESLKEDKKFIIKPLNPYRLLHISPYRSKRFQVHTVYNVIAKIHAPTRNSTDKPTDLLKRIPVKYLKFAEDVRPPYVGTYTKLKDDQAISKLSRNPFSRGLPKTDYDYDSEAEWEEPGEGEDLDSEGEESEDEEEDEMEGFLDDEETDAIGAIKRRPILGNLEPTSTGPCWEGLDTSKMGEVGDLALTRYKLDILMENPQLPIDPYSSEYWETITSTSSINASPRTQSTLMEPPRIPLNPINRQNTLLNSSVPVKGPKIAVSGATVPMKPPKAPKRFIPQELMEEFKQAVKGKDLNKLGLVEILKKQFPKQPKDIIRDTLDLVAERVGPRLTEKRWVLRDGFE